MSRREPNTGGLVVRPPKRDDLSRLTEIYNHYVLTTPITFDVEPYTVAGRRAWFDQFKGRGRYRLVVAERDGLVVGYAGTTRFKEREAYQTTVETTIYCAPGETGMGIGTQLYSALFRTIEKEDINRVVAGYTLPNPASAELHRRFGFRPVGVLSQVGRKFGKYWDVAWVERPLYIASESLWGRPECPCLKPSEVLTIAKDDQPPL